MNILSLRGIKPCMLSLKTNTDYINFITSILGHLTNRDTIKIGYSNNPSFRICNLCRQKVSAQDDSL